MATRRWSGRRNADGRSREIGGDDDVGTGGRLEEGDRESTDWSGPDQKKPNDPSQFKKA
jgi:hypothetical protein